MLVGYCFYIRISLYVIFSLLYVFFSNLFNVVKYNFIQQNKYFVFGVNFHFLVHILETLKKTSIFLQTVIVLTGNFPNRF